MLSTACQWQGLPKDLPPKKALLVHVVGLGWHIAWMSRFRRRAREFERRLKTIAAFIRPAMIRIMRRRLTGSNLADEIQTSWIA